MSRFKLGCVPFLNAKPLIAYYSTPAGIDDAEVVLAPPSELARLIESGEVDAALASSYYALTRRGLQFAPGSSISSAGPVQSVRLFSSVPFGNVRTLALDSGSMTSNHLAQIVLSERFGVRPETISLAPDLPAMLKQADAAVLIGDAGMAAEGKGLEVLDLGAAWNEMTGLPFVWALWIGRGPLHPDLEDSLMRAKAYGLERLEEVAAEESVRLGWPYARCLRYIAEVIDYDLTSSHLEGFSRYAEYCSKLGLLPEHARA